MQAEECVSTLTCNIAPTVLCTGRLLQLHGTSRNCPCRRSLPAGSPDPLVYPLNYALEDSLREDLQVAVKVLDSQFLIVELGLRGELLCRPFKGSFCKSMPLLVKQEHHKVRNHSAWLPFSASARGQLHRAGESSISASLYRLFSHDVRRYCSQAIACWPLFEGLRVTLGAVAQVAMLA